MAFLEQQATDFLSVYERDALERTLEQTRDSLVARGYDEETANKAVVKLGAHTVESTKGVNEIKTRAGFSFVVQPDGDVIVNN